MGHHKRLVMGCLREGTRRQKQKLKRINMRKRGQSRVLTPFENLSHGQDCETTAYYGMNRWDRKEPIFENEEGIDREGVERQSSPDALESVVGFRPKKRQCAGLTPFLCVRPFGGRGRDGRRTE